MTNSQIKIVQNWLIDQLSEQLSLDPENISVNESLTRYGLDSIDAVTMVGDLEDWLDLELPSTLFWDYPTIAQSSAYLVENFDLENISLTANETPVTPAKSAEPVLAGEKKSGLFGRLMGR
ncbi:phosphopantetheine-binding protein [Cyanobacterium stanieri PCC 7202]|uniref:Phosphopantetheine-binding protein n=1 Tax=Cyanobacterium stanieri (strain ATCC 29140 / PCC 7202) TaxID=292563 RepID=K9YLK2_CYASC|nr:phosphopantetheine-binding protein [Cyanobacterium stanieri PCC 7202]